MGLRTYRTTTLALILTTVTSGLQAEDCVLQDRMVSRSNVVIQERTAIRRDVVPAENNQRRCLVDFRVRINNVWHSAMGEYIWNGHQSSDIACAIATNRAEDAVRERVGRQHVMTERTLICKDRPELRELQATVPGTVGDAGQFRVHPNYPNRFMHKGAQCRWFLEPVFRGNDLQQWQGVICELRPNQWVVVDKF